MGFDPLSPIAPARPRALLLPAGKIIHAKFTTFVEHLRAVNVVRLGDVSPDARPNRTMFSPLAFPMGSMIYNLSIAFPPPSHLALSPLELFREPLLILGVADCSEYPNLTSDDEVDESKGVRGRSTAARIKSLGLDELSENLSDLREQYPRALVHLILLFDCAIPTRDLPEGMIAVPPKRLSRTTTMKTVMCDVTSLLLAEMTTYAKSLQALPSIDSPLLSSAKGGPNGFLSWDGNSMTHSLHRSSLSGSPSRSRSRSPLTANRNQHRMSMPAQLSSAATGAVDAVDGSRPGSPPNGIKTPPTTFDEISGAEKSATGQFAARHASKSSGGNVVRELSRDRVPVHGFGSGSLSERARNKGKGRVGLVIGTLYLFAGRWEDAVRELVESASTARANSDHLWHAKALETVTVSLIMLAWAGLDFQIPPICYPTADKSSSLPLRPGNHGESTGLKGPESPSTVSHRLVSLQNLAHLLPDLLNLILALYNRASGTTGESLPQPAYSEFLIRYGKILAAAHHLAGRLDDDALQYFVLNRPLPPKSSIQSPEHAFALSKVWIATMVFRAMPPSSEDGLSAVDKVTIYAGMASILSSLGFRRKKAFILRELVSTLIPSLIQARKVGAAELGVHPAAGLTVLNAAGGEAAGSGSFDLSEHDRESGIEELLATLCRAYGVVGSDYLVEEVRNTQSRGADDDPTANDQAPSRLDQSNDATVARVLRYALLRAYGNQNLKLHVLRCCINVCEALPDFQGVLRFTSELLRTAGSGIAPDAGSHEGSAALSREEQIRLATNISRTIVAARKVGLNEIATDYWDEFLIRGVELLEPSPPRKAIPHRKEELDASRHMTEKPEKTPFIYNPFLKKQDNTKTEKLLIAAEEVEFRVTLQNLFDFEIEIERLSLDTEGVDFICMEHSTIVGAYRKQTMVVTGIPKASGQLKVTGCFVQISGCCTRRFPIFSEPWYRVHDNKARSFRPEVSTNQHQRSTSELSAASRPTNFAMGPKPSILDLNVIEPLPFVVVKETSLPQAAMMMLEGETKPLSITLHNVSTKTPVDTLLFSFEDSTLPPLQAAMRNKDTTAAFMYELELQSRKHAFRWTGEKHVDFRIEPDNCSTMQLEVFGKAGLTAGLVQLDYSHLGPAREGLKDKFHTRQLSVPFTVTVNASVDLVWADILPFSSEVDWSKVCKIPNGSAVDPSSSLRAAPSPSTQSHQLFEALRSYREGTSHCLLVLDIRNSWRNPLVVSLRVASPSTATSATSATTLTENQSHEPDSDGYVTSGTVAPGHTVRFMLPFPRILVRHPWAPIPILDPANRRQFVLNSSRLSSDVERRSREEFWYRNEMLKLLSGDWEDPASGRAGSIELRRIRLNRQMMDIIKLDDLDISMSVSPTHSRAEKSVSRAGPSTYSVVTNHFLTLTTRIKNQSQSRVRAILRLQPSLRSQQQQSFALDLSRKLLWNGLLQQPLATLEPGEVSDTTLSLCILCRGEYQVSASVEEIQLQKGHQNKQSPNMGDDRLLEEGSKRTWHAHEPCTIIAMDGDVDDSDA